MELTGDQETEIDVAKREPNTRDEFDAGATTATTAQNPKERALRNAGFTLELANLDSCHLGQRGDATGNAVRESSRLRARRVAVVVSNEAEGVVLWDLEAFGARHPTMVVT